MAKNFSVFVEINGGIGASLKGALSGVESKLKSLGAHYKASAAAARDAAKGILESYKGVAALAAGSGIAFSAKHAMHDGAELAHELQALRNAGRSAHEVAEGLSEANAAIANMPTATLTNGIKILNETTGAYGDYHHAVENLQFNSKLGDVLKNTVGAEDPAHEIGSIIKMLEIRGSASDPAMYRKEAEKLSQAMVFYGGRLKADDLYTFASNAQVGIKQLDERFLTKIAPALIQEIGGDKVGTGLTAFRTIISGRKITDQKQAQAWKDLGLLKEKDIIKNKKGDVTGWKDGAINGTELAYKDPLKFMEDVILPKLKARGTDIADPIKLGAALNTLFKNTKANAFVTAISSVVDRARLKKDEDLIGKVLSINENYEESKLNDTKVAALAIRSAMQNIGAALTLPLQKPFAQTLISIAQAMNRVSAALIAHPEAAKIVAGIGAALSVLAAVRLANFVFGVSGLVRALAMLSIGAPLSLAGRLIGVARGVSALALSSAIGAARGLRVVAMGLWALAAFPFTLGTRLRGVAAGMAALQAVGGSRLVFATMAGGLGRLGLSILAFPLVALRAVAVGIASGFRLIGAGMWALVANPVGAVVAAIVVSLTALGVWVANNWSGIKAFFGAFGEAFMANLGPGAAGAVSAVVDKLKAVWEWASKLLGPLDETGEKWKAWGTWAGKAAADVVGALANLPAEIGKLAQAGYDLFVNFNWSSAGAAIVSAIGSGITAAGGALVDSVSGLAGRALGAIKGKLGFGGGEAPAAVPGGAPAVAGAPSPVSVAPAAPMPSPRPAGLAGRRAMGGPVARGLPYLVGERGPEIFVPAGHGHVETNGVFSSLAQDRAATTVGAAAVSGASLKVDVDASSIEAAGETAAKSGGIIHASLDTTTSPFVETRSIDEATEKATKLQAILAKVGSSPINVDYDGAPSGAGAAASAGGGAGAAATAAAVGTGRRGFMARGPDGAVAGMPTGGDGPVGDGFYSAISKAEGAKNGYDTVFANGKFGTPDKPVSQMTLAEAYKFSEQVRHNPNNRANAGPLGAFQILGSTMLAHAKRLGLDPSKTKFDADTQKALAVDIAKTEGLGAWEGLKLHPDMMAQARGALRSGNLEGHADSGSERIGANLHTASEQCVALAKAAVGASGSVTSWRRGVHAMEGTLKPGAPVSTFLDRQGRASDRYAGGGTGTPGAHLDHAGVFQSYIRNEAGKIVGMRIAEQYQGSHGVHSKAYYSGKGWGEGNAANYHAVMGSDGRYLGGARNPMARAAETKVANASPGASPPATPAVAVAQASTPKATPLAGARAAGGPVGRGLSYLVGERGPEIFTPGASGGISTNAALDRLTSIGSASLADMPLAEFGRQVVDGSGGEPVAPTPQAVAKARPEGRSRGGDRRGGNFHAGVHNWTVNGGDPREIRGQVESIFVGLLRQFEDDQRGSLSD